tara:strand:+ start:894 stop:2270 length:1377 start_codon:yes stop_codon:yes gene_type:complete
MYNIQSISQPPALNQYEARDRLAQRYYYLRESGGQKLYWDSEELHSNLTDMHLHGSLAAYGVREKDGKAFAAVCKDIINNTAFRPIVLDPIYRPYSASVIQKNDHWRPNSWRKPNVKPNASISAAPFVQHLERMLGSKAKADYLIDMLAYRYQSKTNEKPHVAFYFYGGQGFGKGIFSSTIEAVFGTSAVRTVREQNDLKSMSGIDVWTRTWAIIDEVDVKAGSSCYNNIKTMTGGQSFDSARKGEHFKRFETPAQLIMNSNHAPTFLEADDRRFFVSKWETEFKPHENKTRYFKEYVSWLETKNGYEAIAGLLKQRDVSKVEISAHAMMTEEKEQVTALMSDDVTQDIAAKLDEHKDVNVFDHDMFDAIWIKHELPKAQQKYKMLEAGLGATKQKAYENQRRTLWIRKGFKLVAGNGVAAMLLNEKFNTSVQLKSDLGYQHSVNKKHIKGWFGQHDF